MNIVEETLGDLIQEPAHVGFVVTDLEEAVARAQHLYGFTPDDVEYQPPAGVDAPTRFAFFSVAGLQFEYIEPASEHFKALMLGEACGAGGINHLAWRVSDIELAVVRLADRGIAPGYVTPDGIVQIGAKRMVYLDPATTGGLLVELLQYPD